MDNMDKIRIADFSLVPRLVFDKKDGCLRFTMGEASYLVEGSSSGGHILVGRYSSLARNLRFNIGQDHPLHPVSTYPFKVINDRQEQIICDLPPYGGKRSQVIIGSDVWIAENVTIMGGVRIGNGAMIGANTTVAKNIPPYAVAVGNPARVVKYRFSAEIIKKLQKIRWWYWPDKTIRENLSLMETPEKFCEKYCPPALENAPVPDSPIANDLRALRQAGNKIYYIFADFGRRYPIWKKTVEEFIAACQSDTPKILLLELPASGNYYGGPEMIAQMLAAKGEAAPHIFTHADAEEIPSILANIDYFITTREIQSIFGIDFAEEYGATILSGIDSDIFTD